MLNETIKEEEKVLYRIELPGIAIKINDEVLCNVVKIEVRDFFIRHYNDEISNLSRKLCFYCRKTDSSLEKVLEYDIGLSTTLE